MEIMLAVHVAAGALGIVAGFVALFAAKGGALHRRSGALFVSVMLVMGLSGSLIAAARAIEGSVVGGLLAAYLVVTALTTVRPRTAGARRLDLGAMVVALAVGAACVALGIEAAGGAGHLDGIPAPMFFLFGAIGLAAGASDFRLLRPGGGVQGARRLRRHLWRMCVALWIAAASFFLGQADEFPEPLRVPALLAIPAFLPLVVMPYWLWRVRKRRADPRILPTLNASIQ